MHINLIDVIVCCYRYRYYSNTIKETEWHFQDKRQILRIVGICLQSLYEKCVLAQRYLNNIQKLI